MGRFFVVFGLILLMASSAIAKDGPISRAVKSQSSTRVTEALKKLSLRRPQDRNDLVKARYLAMAQMNPELANQLAGLMTFPEAPHLALRVAINEDDIDEAAFWVAKGGRVENSDQANRLATLAAGSGRHDLVVFALKERANHFGSILKAAAEECDPKTIEVISDTALKAGAPIRSKFFREAFSLAAYSSRMQVLHQLVRLALLHKIELNVEFFRGAFIDTARSTHLVVQLEVKKLAEANGVLIDHRSIVQALTNAAFLGDGNAFDQVLAIAKELDITISPADAQSVLGSVLHEGDPGAHLVWRLKELGADVNKRFNTVDQPVVVAANHMNTDVMLSLLEAGAILPTAQQHRSTIRFANQSEGDKKLKRQIAFQLDPATQVADIRTACVELPFVISGLLDAPFVVGKIIANYAKPNPLMPDVPDDEKQARFLSQWLFGWQVNMAPEHAKKRIAQAQRTLVAADPEEGDE